MVTCAIPMHLVTGELAVEHCTSLSLLSYWYLSVTLGIVLELSQDNPANKQNTNPQQLCLLSMCNCKPKPNFSG